MAINRSLNMIQRMMLRSLQGRKYLPILFKTVSGGGGSVGSRSTLCLGHQSTHTHTHTQEDLEKTIIGMRTSKHRDAPEPHFPSLSV